LFSYLLLNKSTCENWSAIVFWWLVNFSACEKCFWKLLCTSCSGKCVSNRRLRQKTGNKIYFRQHLKL